MRNSLNVIAFVTDRRFSYAQRRAENGRITIHKQSKANGS
ncbi:hypothetical protein UC317_2275 [Lactococcus lactis subsp. lactis]|nr:hypothetical protein UC317_2275 [Lactococcus lactis subsp. lactis]